MANKRIYDLTEDSTPDDTAFVVVDASSLGAPIKTAVTHLRQRKASGSPTTGSYEAGDTIWSTGASALGYAGWICTAAGSPGDWHKFGALI